MAEYDIVSQLLPERSYQAIETPLKIYARGRTCQVTLSEAAPREIIEEELNNVFSKKLPVEYVRHLP